MAEAANRKKLGEDKLDELHATSRMGRRNWRLEMEDEVKGPYRAAVLRNDAADPKPYAGKATVDHTYSKAPAQPEIPKASPKDLGLMHLTSKIDDPVQLIK